MQAHGNEKPTREGSEALRRKEQTNLYGGQAIIEGVMMKGPNRTVAACRNFEGKIVHKILREGEAEKKRNSWYKAPFFRGFLVLVDSLSVGYQALMYSGEVADPEGKPRNPIVENVAIIVSLAFALVIFTFIPILLTKLILGFDLRAENVTIWQSVGFSAIEGVIKAGVLVGYILSIRLIPDIKRVFMYHGSEHKTINAYEAGSDLSIDDVMKYPTFHPRCGTSFLFAVILISLILAMFFPLLTLWIFNDSSLALNMFVRFGIHIVFLPIIASLGYEFIRFTGRFRHDHPFMRILTYPGQLFQKITAIEPDRKMVEVALVSMHLAMGLDNQEHADPIEEKPESAGENTAVSTETG